VSSMWALIYSASIMFVQLDISMKHGTKLTPLEGITKPM